MFTMSNPTTPHPMSAGHRHADGSKRRDRAPKPRVPGANVLWKRLTDNVDDLVIKTAKNPELVSEVSRLVLFGHLSKAEGAAARRYAEIAGFQDRHMGITKRHLASPSYERGFGKDDEVERHEAMGTTKEYERRAKKAKKDFKLLDDHIGATGARDLIETVCLYDRRVNEREYRRLALVLRGIAYKLGILTEAEAKSTAESAPVERRDAKTVAEAAVDTLESCFTKLERPNICLFSVGALPGIERSITAYTEATDATKAAKHTIRVKITGMIPGELDAQLLRAAEAKGWKEKA